MFNRGRESGRGNAAGQTARTGLDGARNEHCIESTRGDPSTYDWRDRRRYSDDIHAIEDIANGFDLPPGACQSWQRLYFGTARLVDELRYHIHLEHNVLFPRLLADRQN